MVVENDEEEIPISHEQVQKHILNMLHFHFRLSNCHACDAEGQKSELEALKKQGISRCKRGRNGRCGRDRRYAR